MFTKVVINLELDGFLNQSLVVMFIPVTFMTVQVTSTLINF